MILRRTAAVTAIASLAIAAPAAAQGNGHGNAYGHYKSTVSSAAPSPSSPANAPNIPGSGVRNFGSWLDDASVMDPGTGFVSFGFGLFKTPVYREIDLPSVDSGFAVNSRLQVGMTVPYFHANEAGGPLSRGFGDVYVNAKYQLRAPTHDSVGIGLIPMIEVLSVAPPSGGGRVQWALPLSVEKQATGWRLMGSGGYFSRGALFGAGALEVELSKRAWATGSLSHSYSTRRDELSAALGLHTTRTDLAGGLTYALRPDVAVYGSVGRTISAHDANSATMIFAAGISLGVTRPVR